MRCIIKELKVLNHYWPLIDDAADAARQFDLAFVAIATAKYGRSINSLLQMTATQEDNQVHESPGIYAFCYVLFVSVVELGYRV
ncbi:unnamed protein product [Lasius platythorax]|uniref:Uncharacterized protein n=1 Tax=Lasius platythorax TaxID=488582 RepID=A0AAV2N8W2_9HYME